MKNLALYAIILCHTGLSFSQNKDSLTSKKHNNIIKFDLFSAIAISSYNNGPALGISYERVISDKISIEIQLSHARYDYAYFSSYPMVDYDTGLRLFDFDEFYSENYRRTSISPIMRYYLSSQKRNKGVYFLIGGFLSFTKHHYNSYINRYNYAFPSTDYDYYPTKEYETIYYKASDLGLNFGIGYQTKLFQERLALDANLSYIIAERFYSFSSYDSFSQNQSFIDWDYKENHLRYTPWMTLSIGYTF